MGTTIRELEPKSVWTFFDEINQVPRPSKKEEKIIAYLEAVAQKYGLEYKKDKVGNILISKPASKGYEAKATIVMQSHMDMVCEKNNQTNHNFETDPIQTMIDGEWLKAQGTTLGADNGIGMAYQLAVLTDNSLEHGPIECLFTIDEETGLTGANALEPGFFTGKTLLNLDSEDLGEVFIGCAGGVDTVATFPYTEEKIEGNQFFFRLGVTGLKGGHSGCDIHLGLGNANRILARFLLQVQERWALKLICIDGGNLRNAIPREASCVAAIPFEAREELRILLNHFIIDIEQEIKAVEPNVQLVLESTDAHTTCIDQDTTRRLLLALHTAPHGVIAMSHDLEGLVETSTNLASVKMKEGNKILVTTSQRSSIESAKHDTAKMVENVFVLAGAKVEHGDGYPGWKPNAESPILKSAQEVYTRLFGAPMEVKAIHAGLECGLFSVKYPGLDMISFGPTMRGVHSPDERLHIPSVGVIWTFLCELLKNA